MGCRPPSPGRPRPPGAPGPRDAPPASRNDKSTARRATHSPGTATEGAPKEVSIDGHLIISQGLSLVRNRYWGIGLA